MAPARRILLAAAVTLVIAVAPPFAAQNPPPPRDTSSRAVYGRRMGTWMRIPPGYNSPRITGTIRVAGCHVGPERLHLFVRRGGRPDAPAGRVEVRRRIHFPAERAFFFTYTVTSLPAGSYTVQAAIDPDACPTGAWQPNLWTVMVPAPGKPGARRVDFTYTPPEAAGTAPP